MDHHFVVEKDTSTGQEIMDFSQEAKRLLSILDSSVEQEILNRQQGREIQVVI